MTTLFEQHDLRLVALAAFVCALSAFAGIALLAHARRASGAIRLAWLTVAAISVGFGIWVTHFVAMLAFSTGMPTGYDVGTTLISLIVAILIVGAGLGMASLGKRPTDRLLGGAVVGVGISAMHYIGMAALIIGGEILWSGPLVALSVLFGMGLGALGLHVGLGSRGLVSRFSGAGLLTLAICAMHFTGMGAADLSRCFPILTAEAATPRWMSPVLAISSILILLAGLGSILLDLRERRRALDEAERMRDLADAAVEGLIVFSGGRIVSANRSFLQLAGLPISAKGRPIGDFFTPEALESLSETRSLPIEVELRTADGRVLPVECIRRPVTYAGKPHHALAVRDLSARRQAEQHIRFLAHHDALTGLLNRASFYRILGNEIVTARRLGQVFAVLCLDLDRFKEVNDLYGHPAGDALLEKLGGVLMKAVGDHGTPSRLGGDEFAILLRDIETPARAGRMADTILEAIIAAMEASPMSGMVSASIGIALSTPSIDAEQLISQADTALYRAKQDGRGVFRFYEAEMGAEVRDRRLLEHDLRNAIVRGELSIEYQPQVEVQTGEVVGFEALLRWRHPARGAVSPSVFVPVAEESGLILPLGEWVLRAACREAARWKAAISVAVNVSTVQLHAPGFPELVGAVLAETGLDPDRLEIEITETALVKDVARAVAVLERIRSIGVRIAMDDFGTGYSSLANLRAFPFSKIKVDRSFIQSVDTNPQSAAIVRAVLGLGSGLDVPVVAEGVERPEELAFLRGEICQSAQGYLLARPSPIEMFADITAGHITRLGPASGTPALRVVG
ncbi:MAG: bifunctional diguanylate cyclase/phosphodiesterase [Devosia sp.]